MFIVHLGCFPFLSSTDNAAVIIVYAHVLVDAHVYVFQLCVQLQVELLGHQIGPSLSLLDNSKQFSKVVLIYTPISSVRIPDALCNFE